MRGGPQVVWGASGVFHRPRRSDPDRAACGPLVVKPWLGESGTMSAALRYGLRPCRRPACALTETQHSPTTADLDGSRISFPHSLSHRDMMT